METTNKLTVLEKILVIFPITYLFSVDRFVMKKYKSALAKLLLTLTGVSIIFWIFEIVMIIKNKFQKEISKYFKQEFTDIQVALIICPISNMLGLDRIIYGHKLSGYIRLLFGLILIGLVLYIIDLVKLFMKKYDNEIII